VVGGAQAFPGGEGAGTVEFLVSGDEFYFIEMNTRLQVEHPVTEEVTGLDIVAEQIRIAEGHVLSFSQDEIQLQGHAIESRIYAESPDNNFMPSSGEITSLDTSRAEARIEAGYQAGNTVTPYYDPMLFKVVSSAATRDEAIEKMDAALGHFHMTGPQSNRKFLLSILRSPDYRKNNISTSYLDKNPNAFLGDELSVDPTILAGLMTAVSIRYDYGAQEENTIWDELAYWRFIPHLSIKIGEEQYPVHLQSPPKSRELKIVVHDQEMLVELISQNNKYYNFRVHGISYAFWAGIHQSEITIENEQFSVTGRRMDILDNRYLTNGRKNSSNTNSNSVQAPLNGKVIRLEVTPKKQVKEGDVLLVIESMKMENKLLSPRDGRIGEILTREGEQVKMNDLLITINEE